MSCNMWHEGKFSVFQTKASFRAFFCRCVFFTWWYHGNDWTMDSSRRGASASRRFHTHIWSSSIPPSIANHPSPTRFPGIPAFEIPPIQNRMPYRIHSRVCHAHAVRSPIGSPFGTDSRHHHRTQKIEISVWQHLRKNCSADNFYCRQSSYVQFLCTFALWVKKIKTQSTNAFGYKPIQIQAKRGLSKTARAFTTDNQHFKTINVRCCNWS